MFDNAAIASQPGLFPKVMNAQLDIALMALTSGVTSYQGTAGHGGAGQNRTGQDRTGQDRTGQETVAGQTGRFS